MIKRILKSVLISLFILLLMLILLIKRPTFTLGSDALKVSVVDVSALQQHVKQLSHEIKVRSFSSFMGLNAASDYIETQMKNYHAGVTIQPYQIKGVTYQNVIASHGPKYAPIIVVGAHYDTYGELPGADDNASGVAGLLELNRLLVAETEAGRIFNKQIMLVAYTLEEPPIYASNGMGSVVHAESIKGQEVELMISLEMIGYFTDEPDSQDYPISALRWVYPDTGHFITVVDELFSNAGPRLKKTFNQQGKIEAYSINAPAVIPGVDFSDHRSYWALGIPAIMVTDTAFYRNKNYHTADDTFDTLDYQRMSYVVSGVLEHLQSLAQ